MPWLRKPELLTFEEITRLVRILAAIGVREVRLTGGEPLVRAGLPDLVRALADIPGVEDLSITTNGVLLDRLAAPLAAAGLRRLNVSLDSLSHTRFAEITRRDALDRVLAGLRATERHAQLGPIKINCVAIRGFLRTRNPRPRRAGPPQALRRALPGVHAARRRRALGRRRGAERGGGARDRRAPLATDRAARQAILHLAAVSLRRRHRRNRLHQPGHRAGSAPTATASASPPTDACAPACSRVASGTCATRSATVRPTPTSRRACARRFATRSSSTASTTADSSARAAR
jgi:hypothetical protein